MVFTFTNQAIVNAFENSSIDMSPMRVVFGDSSIRFNPFLQAPVVVPEQPVEEYVVQLNDMLAEIRELAFAYLKKTARRRRRPHVVRTKGNINDYLMTSYSSMLRLIIINFLLIQLLIIVVIKLARPIQSLDFVGKALVRNLIHGNLMLMFGIPLLWNSTFKVIPMYFVVDIGMHKLCVSFKSLSCRVASSSYCSFFQFVVLL